MFRLGFDIGSNSVGSAWVDTELLDIATGTSIFPAGVDESDDKRGDPKNAKRRMTRRTRITLARRANRKRGLRLKLIAVGLLPTDAAAFRQLLETTDPWELRRKGLNDFLTPYEFGRILLHLAQRRGALGLSLPDLDEEERDGDDVDDGKVKAAITAVRAKMKERNAETFGEFIAMVRTERITPITTPDQRPPNERKGPRQWRAAVRNKAASYEHCADRTMIRKEFNTLWKAQKELGGPLAKLLTDELRLELDDDRGDSTWKHKGLLFGQRRQSWDLGTLGRCVLEPTERCAPHADMYASRYLVVETINNLKIIERGAEPRPLDQAEREKIRTFLSGPLGMSKPKAGKGKKKDGAGDSSPRPKSSVSVTDLRNHMGTAAEGWGKSSKTGRFRFNIEADEDRTINTDWFSREIIFGSVTKQVWDGLDERIREGINRAILKYDPDDAQDAEKLKAGVMAWAKLSPQQADALVAAWRRRPKPDAKRLNMSRRAVRNILALMDRSEQWPDPNRPGQHRWITQIEARKLIAQDEEFKDQTTGRPLDHHARRRYATGAKGATARDRYYMGKHVLLKNGEPIIGPDGRPLAEPPPAPLISNPVVRKAIHEVRRHLVEYMTTFGRKPDEVYIELAREAKMGKMDADRALFTNRLRNRIRNDIIQEFGLEFASATQQRAAVDRVVLCVQQNRVCPLCGRGGLTERNAANGTDCEVAHIIPKGSGGHNGLGNIVLGHTVCNREMGRRTPRDYWNAASTGGFDEAIARVEQMYGDIERPKFSQIKAANGNLLWLCYFSKHDDAAKINQFKKDVKDIKDMTARQDAATKYAARQVMAYLADSLFDGKGLPERASGNARDDDRRLIFATDGLWTSRLRREWGLFFDPHNRKAKGLGEAEEHSRKEKDRGDHRHHAIDAVVIAYCTRDVQMAWEEREKQADRDNVNTADEEQMDNYRRNNPLRVPKPFKSREEFRETVRKAVFGDGATQRPICHRPVKRKLIGEFHEAFPRGPVLDRQGSLTDKFTKRIDVLALDANHLRVPRPETEKEAIARLAERRRREKSVEVKVARKWARQVVASPGYMPAIIDPPPGKSGIVRDCELRRRLRECFTNEGLNPDDFTAKQLKALVESGKLCQASGVPIRSAVLLWTMADPVVVSKWESDHSTGQTRKIFDADTRSGDARAARAYIGGNNHHIEIRIDAEDKWSGVMVTTFEAAQRKLARLRALRAARIPKPDEFKKLGKAERAKLTPILREIEQAHPMVDRRDDDSLGGRFIMSLCEGEMLHMKHKDTGDEDHFVVAKLDKPNGIVVVPHWDARAATERKNADGEKVANSKREQFTVTPSDLKRLAPPGQPHARKVLISPLGRVSTLERD